MKLRPSAKHNLCMNIRIKYYTNNYCLHYKGIIIKLLSFCTYPLFGENSRAMETLAYCKQRNKLNYW